MKETDSKPTIRTYDLLRCLCAALAKNKKLIVDPQRITEQVQANDVTEGINKLQTFGVAGRINSKLVIYLTEKEADIILKECGENTKNLVTSMAASI